MEIKKEIYYAEFTKRVIEALDTLMVLRMDFKRDQEESKDEWKHREQLQAYRDCLECFKRSGIITEYNLVSGKIDYTPIRELVISKKPKEESLAEQTFMGFTQSELCDRMSDFLLKEINRKRKEAKGAR